MSDRSEKVKHDLPIRLQIRVHTIRWAAEKEAYYGRTPGRPLRFVVSSRNEDLPGVR